MCTHGIWGGPTRAPTVVRPFTVSVPKFGEATDLSADDCFPDTMGTDEGEEDNHASSYLDHLSVFFCHLRPFVTIAQDVLTNLVHMISRWIFSTEMFSVC